MHVGSRLPIGMQPYGAGTQQATLYSGGTQADSDRYRQVAGIGGRQGTAGSKQAASKHQAGSRQEVGRQEAGRQAVGKQTA
jgi:hypothetical protein